MSWFRSKAALAQQKEGIIKTAKKSIMIVMDLERNKDFIDEGHRIC